MKMNRFGLLLALACSTVTSLFGMRANGAIKRTDSQTSLCTVHRIADRVLGARNSVVSKPTNQNRVNSFAIDPQLLSAQIELIPEPAIQNTITEIRKIIARRSSEHPFEKTRDLQYVSMRLNEYLYQLERQFPSEKTHSTENAIILLRNTAYYLLIELSPKADAYSCQLRPEGSRVQDIAAKALGDYWLNQPQSVYPQTCCPLDLHC